MELTTILGLLVRHGLTTGAGALVAHGLLAQGQTEPFVGAAMLVLGVAWSAWQKYGHAKVAAKLADLGVKAVILGLAVLAIGAPRVLAADLPQPVAKAAPFAYTPCTVQACSGWYVGAHIQGVGSNLDILGSGVNGSIFAGGGMVGLDAGYVLWNGVWFAGAEVGGDIDVTGGPVAGSPFKNRWFGYQVVKLGRGLQDVFNFQAASAVPGQGPTPISIPQSIASSLISPYVQFGAAERDGAIGWVSGAGASFVVAQGWNLDLSYMRVQYQGATISGVALHDDNLVKIALNRVW
jgi:opacity protein-like surface antigen